MANRVRSKVKVHKNIHKRFKKKMESLEKREIQIGFGKERHGPSGFSYATLAGIHNFGIGVTRRPFIQYAFELWVLQGIDLVAPAIAKIIYKDQPVVATLRLVAEPMTEIMTFSIDAGNWPITNNPTPLIDTGALRIGAKYWVSSNG